MESRLLIINCPSDYFVHVPMGTFGLCDYLSKKNIPVKLLNLSLYDNTEIDRMLEYYMDLFRPTHIGLILHWQETAEGFLWVGEYIKSRFRHLKVISGGFTAGYFGKNLLERCSFVDYLIKGDPEKPLELLLGGAELSKIPNLISRKNTEICSNEASYFIDQETLSHISFCELTYLYDHELYIKATEEKLGFPLFIGRGCELSCHYCGGSRVSFKQHSGRVNPVVRSIDSVIADLKRLQDYTRKIYLCYENDRDYIKALFKAMKEEKFLVKIFHLNYGAWQLFDKEFLELYRDLFIFDKDHKPLFELSPEVFDDQSRKQIKHPSVTYSIKDLKENLFLIENYLSDSVKVSLFFSQYHYTHKTYHDMKKEIACIFRLTHDLFCNNLTVKVYYDHLSTDVASQYWESYVEHPQDFDTLMSATRKLKAQEHYSFPFNNLCIYIPETLSEKDIIKCELLIAILKILVNHFHEMFNILFQCLDELTVELIEEIIKEEYSDRPGNTFTSLNEYELLNFIKQKIMQKETLLSRIPFIEDLTNFCIKKAICMRRPMPYRSLYQAERPRLNHAFISVNDHDYLDLDNLLDKLRKEGPGHVTPEKTVFIFLADEILSMSYIVYRSTLKKFENGFSLDDYYVLMKKKGIFDIPYHKNLVAKLFKSDVLY
ncbi:MAG: radical SAM protein [Nitrospirota bacterium]